MSSTLLRPLALWLGYDLRTVRRSDSIDLCLKRYFSHHSPSLLIDVGAHIGEFGRLARSCGYKGEIVSFEPSSASFERLNRWARSDPKWRTFNHALGSQHARVSLHLNAGSNFNSLLPARSAMMTRFPSLTNTGSEEVAVERLCDVLDRLGIDEKEPIFLKSDTQGHDLEVLKGAGSRMQQINALLLEMSVQPIYEGAPSHWDTGAFVRQAGFEAYSYSSVSRDGNGGLIEYDALFKRV